MSKSWLITGVSSGLGRELAQAALAAEGRVVGTLRRPEQRAAFEALAPGRATAMMLDVTDAAATARAVREAWDRLGGIDVLVNNAGYGLLGCLEELSEDEVRRCMDTNFGGTLATIRAVLPLMREQRRGDILNFSSLAGLIGIPGMAAYSAAKFAVEGLSDALAGELRPFGIRVMAIEPGGFRTQFSLGSLKTSDQRIAAYDGTSGGMTRSAMSSYAGSEQGDPAKLARLLVEMVDGPELPSHFVCGGDAIKRYRRRLEQTIARLETWQTMGSSTDFEPRVAGE